MAGGCGWSEEGSGLTATGERGRAIGTRLQWEILEIEIRNSSLFSSVKCQMTRLQSTELSNTQSKCKTSTKSRLVVNNKEKDKTYVGAATG